MITRARKLIHFTFVFWKFSDNVIFTHFALVKRKIKSSLLLIFCLNITKCVSAGVLYLLGIMTPFFDLIFW